MKFLFSLFAFFMLTASCDSSKITTKKNDIVQNKLSGRYSITQIGNNSSISNKLVISFDETSNRVSGFAGCNQYFGTFTLQNSIVKFSNLASSKKYCKEDVMTVEFQFLKTLEKVNTFVIKDNILSFFKDDKSMLKAIKTDANKIVITYKALSRGPFEYIQISKSEVLVATDVNLKDISKYNSKEKDWKELKRLIETIDLETLKNIESPTEKRFFDGAATANLAILKGDVTFMTPSFDHGFPPKEIEALVNKVLSIKESVTKQ